MLKRYPRSRRGAGQLSGAPGQGGRGLADPGPHRQADAPVAGLERMRVSVQIRPNPEDRRLLSGMADYARRIEASGFPGIWVGDSLGRGRPTLDPLAILAALAAATERVELGIAVLQVSLRHPIELAHRVQSVQALSGGRLRLGVGSGSTRADFELLGGDYDQRFRTLTEFARDHAAGVARRAGQWRDVVDLAGLRGRAADPDRRLAQPALDHLCREGMPGLDAVRPLQQLGGSRSTACASIARRAAPTRFSPMSRSTSPTGRNPPSLADGRQCRRWSARPTRRASG